MRADWDQADCRRRLVEADPGLAQIVETMPGLRLLRQSSVTEVFFGFMCSANNHLPRILSMNAVLSACGDSIAEGFNKFPTTYRIAALDESTLRGQGFGYRAGTISRAAQEVLARGGDPYLEALKDASYPEARQELISIPGIGPKLADCICLFGLDKTEAVPVDTHIWHAGVSRYFPEWRGLALTNTRYLAIADHLRGLFGPLSGLAQQYLFYDRLLNWRKPTSLSPMLPWQRA